MSPSEGLEPPAPRSRPLQGGFETVVGERTTAAVHRIRSLESRLSSVLAVGLICAIGFGMLAWYYGTALHRPARAAQSAKSLAASRAQGEMALPSLGVIVDPALAHAADPPASAQSTPQPSNPGASSEPSAESSSFGVLPAVPGPESTPPYAPSGIPGGGWIPPQPPSSGASVPSPAPRPLDRRLSGPVFARQTESAGASTPEAATVAVPGDSTPPPTPTLVAATGGAAQHDELTELLMPSPTPAVPARVLPTQRLLLPKGAFIDCTLETAIDSTLPGMTTCVTATDTFSADGKVVLLERGSKLVGETRGEVQQGSARVFVLWTEARTPTGVVIPLASPGTDELGRSGLAGQVDNHFWQRFGAAILISIIDAAAESAVQSASNTIIYSPSTSQDVVAGVLKDTLRIPPTVLKNQGDRIQILVARDLDFRSVYELRPQSAR